MDIFFSSEGIHSPDLLEQRAANLAVSSAMADAPASIYPPLHAALLTAIDHKQHDAISPTEVKIYFTPAGQNNALTCAVHHEALPHANLVTVTSMACWNSRRRPANAQPSGCSALPISSRYHKPVVVCCCCVLLLCAAPHMPLVLRRNDRCSPWSQSHC